MKLTESQQDAIRYRGSNLLVSASAGSGKTEVLARRCLSLIADPQQPCGVDRLLVVTFTRAAAAELRVRIARMLRREADQTRDAALRDHLRRQEILVDVADIGTIDAWCGRIVRDHSAEANLDGRFTMLGEEDARLLRKQVLDELFEWVYVVDDPEAAAARDWLGRHGKPNDEFLRRLVRRLNHFRENLVEVQRWFGQQRELHARGADELRADARELLAGALAEECTFQGEQLTAMLADGSRPRLLGILQQLREALAHWATQLPRCTSADELLALVREIHGFKLRRPRGLPPADQAVLDEVGARWLKARLQKRWEPGDVESILASAPAAGRLVGTLLELEQRYQDRLTAAKRARAACEFHDVLRLALDLLGKPTDSGPREPTEIALRLRGRYEHILVDEYQDTSPVQVEILRLVTRDEAGRSNRFMVGDVKQSIYGFRQAEPRLFAELVRVFESGSQEGTVRYLSDNFRSHPALLAGLNRMFASLFHPLLGGTAFGEQERLRTGRDEIANPTLEGQPRIELHLFEPGRDDETRAGADKETIPLERLEREAVIAAGLIRDMLHGGVQVPHRDEQGTLTLRPLRRSDIVILLRSAKQNAAVVAGVLRQVGIPCLTSGRDALFDLPEALDVRNVLALLANRRQELPLAAYLRGPMVGLSAAELLRIRSAAPKADFCDAVAQFCEGHVAADERDELSPKLRGALAQLDQWSVAAREQELPELLRRILHDSGLLLFAAGLPGGEHRVALLRAIENFAAEFVHSGQQGVAEFVAHVEDLAAADLEPGVPVAAGEDAVCVMTIHAAKGLEFPVVLLLNAGGRFNRQRASEPLQCDEASGLGLSFGDYPARTDVVSARHHIVKYGALQRDIEEELRLLYVATTRARERLLIFGQVPPGAWEQARAQYAGQQGPPPLASRLSADNALEWVLMAAASSETHAPKQGPPLVGVTTHTADQIGALPAPDEQARLSAPPAEWSPEDEAWLRRGQTLLGAPVDTSLAELPAVLSVSAIKELARPEGQEDVPHALDAGSAALRVPTFAASGEPEGRVVGSACHRFLEHADWRRLTSEADVRRQIDALVAAGRLSTSEAALVPAADVAWLGNTRIGELLAAQANEVRREVAFVRALPIGRDNETTIVRGVIDCLLETDAGLLILDYKTDRVADAAALRQRVADYTVQLQLYAQAAGGIFDRPVSQALLGFLHAREIVEVRCEPLTPQRWLGALAGSESG